MTIKHINSFGIYGGASLNSVETALLETDGLDIFKVSDMRQFFYPDGLVNDIRSIIGRRDLSLDYLRHDEKVMRTEQNITEFYAKIINNAAEKTQIDVVGVDGLTLLNKPEDNC